MPKEAAKTNMADAKSLSIDFVWKHLTGFLDQNVSKKKGNEGMVKFFKEICGGSVELELFLLHGLREWFLGK